MTGNGLSLQYRRTQGKLHFRSRFDFRPLDTYFSSTHLTIKDSTGNPSEYYIMNNWMWGGGAEYKLRLGVEKQLKLKKMN